MSEILGCLAFLTVLCVLWVAAYLLYWVAREIRNDVKMNEESRRELAKEIKE